MSLWPRSLFGRLTLLLIAVVAIAMAAMIVFFRLDRVELLDRHFGDTTVVQLQALRTALDSADTTARRETLRALGTQYGVRIVPEAERPMVGGPPLSARMSELEDRLRRDLGPETMLRVAPRMQLLFVRVVAGDAGYWIGFPLPQRPGGGDWSSRAILWSIALALSLIVAAFLFTRYLGRPLRELNAAVLRVGRGETPPPLPESGPSEIAELNRGFNRMIANLSQLEQDRALLLAGVSHDLRTPLARLRLGLELGVPDPEAREGMTEDIEEMDRVIGQFLDFARGDQTTAAEICDPDEIVAGVVERYQRAGKDVRFAPSGKVSGDASTGPGPSSGAGPGAPAGAPALELRRTAFARLVANLVDNALAYGAPPVEVSSAVLGSRYQLDIADRGPGIPPEDVARLKQPFTRASVARASATGVAGAGLGLAIVERIARMHGGSFDLLPRDGGGTIARVVLPAA